MQTIPSTADIQKAFANFKIVIDSKPNMQQLEATISANPVISTINTKVDSINNRVDNKADTASLDTINSSLTAAQTNITSLTAAVNAIVSSVQSLSSSGTTTNSSTTPNNVAVAIAKGVWLGLSNDAALNAARSMFSTTRFTTVINELNKKTTQEIKGVAVYIAAQSKAFKDAAEKTALLNQFKANLYQHSGTSYVAFDEGGLTDITSSNLSTVFLNDLNSFYTNNYQTLIDFADGKIV